MDRDKRSHDGMLTKSRLGRATGEHNMGEKSKPSPQKIKLSVGDTVIVTDKQRLIKTSPYFASLLRFHASDDLEAVSLVPPKNVDLESFLAVLNNLSSTSLKLNITAENLWDSVVLSKYFQVEEMENKCWKAFRKLLPTLTMDELLHVWRNGHACAVDKVTTLALVGISLKMGLASESMEFLDFSADELVALMADECFLPLSEAKVCEAIRAWCEHDPEDRKKNEVLERVFAEVVWDESTKPVIESILPQYRQPSKMLKRTVNSDDHRIPDDGLLKKVNASAGVIIGNFLYFLRDGGVDYGIPAQSFYRMDMNDEKRKKKLDPIGVEELQLDPDDSEAAKYSLCIVRLADGDKIGCFGSHMQYLRYEQEHNLANIISLYDTATDEWRDLPSLPLPRADCAMIQCGSFLYVIGGTEHKALDKEGDNAQHCFRLDLIKFTADPKIQWERIADLNAPRIDHKVKIHYGRIIVCAGKTCTMVADDDEWGDDDDGADERAMTLRFRDARWSEAYDPTLNCWTVLQLSA